MELSNVNFNASNYATTKISSDSIVGYFIGFGADEVTVVRLYKDTNRDFNEEIGITLLEQEEIDYYSLEEYFHDTYSDYAYVKDIKDLPDYLVKQYGLKELIQGVVLCDVNNGCHTTRSTEYDGSPTDAVTHFIASEGEIIDV